ncbi:MAG: hypothetical protein QFB87_02520 [Patescibacteria group bacterium]|nr:hypothetical protein [Patescibacteria group bacterium]
MSEFSRKLLAPISAVAFGSIALSGCATNPELQFDASKVSQAHLQDQLLPEASFIRVSPQRVETADSDNHCFKLNKALHLRDIEAVTAENQGVSQEGDWIGLTPAQLPKNIADACASKNLWGGRVWFAKRLLKEEVTIKNVASQ